MRMELNIDELFWVHYPQIKGTNQAVKTNSITLLSQIIVLCFIEK